MILDANTIDQSKVPCADLCIVGGGMMGIALAHRFVGHSASVIVVEGGNDEIDLPMQELYRLEMGGIGPINDPFIARTRALGGSSRCWGGWSRPFGRDVLSKWPIDPAELDPHWKDVNDLFGLRNLDYDDTKAWLAKRGQLMDYGPGLTTGVRHIKPVRMWPKYGPCLEKASNVRVVYNLNATGFDLNEAKNQVQGLRTETIAGTKFTVNAKAMGGLENPILLLNANREHNNAIGNSGDALGRYYMDHIEMTHGLIIREKCICPEFFENKVQHFYSLDKRLPEYSHLPNHALGLWIYHTACNFRDRAGQNRNPRTRDLKKPGTVYLQHAPRPVRDSRVQLSESKNRFGLHNGLMQWKIDPQDIEDMRFIARELERRFGANGLGRLKLTDGIQHTFHHESGFVFNGRHFMGATRMATNDKEGVVDRDLKVFGMNNLYISGASVFPSYCWCGPTYTAMALNFRLGEHLGKRLAAA